MDEAVFIRAKVERKDIFYLNSIVEAYDGLALMSTLDASEGLIGFCLPEAQLSDFLLLLDNLAKELFIDYRIAQSIKTNFLKEAEFGENSGN